MLVTYEHDIDFDKTRAVCKVPIDYDKCPLNFDELVVALQHDFVQHGIAEQTFTGEVNPNLTKRNIIRLLTVNLRNVQYIVRRITMSSSFKTGSGAFNTIYTSSSVYITADIQPFIGTHMEKLALCGKLADEYDFRFRILSSPDIKQIIALDAYRKHS